MDVGRVTAWPSLLFSVSQYGQNRLKRRTVAGRVMGCLEEGKALERVELEEQASRRML